MIREFIATVYVLALAGQWSDMREYFALIRELLNAPTATIVAGTVTDKEV